MTHQIIISNSISENKRRVQPLRKCKEFSSPTFSQFRCSLSHSGLVRCLKSVAIKSSICLKHRLWFAFLSNTIFLIYLTANSQSTLVHSKTGLLHGSVNSRVSRISDQGLPRASFSFISTYRPLCQHTNQNLKHFTYFAETSKTCKAHSLGRIV